MNYKNKKILVTGGSGFIGINLANELASQGAFVTIIDKNDEPFGYLDKIIIKIKADITKKELENVDNEFEYVFHLAARTDINSDDVNDYYENYQGTEKLLKWLDKNKLKKFVLYSTQLVVGIQDVKRFVDEKEPYWTRTAYGESKIKAEKITRKMCNAYNIKFVIVRPTSVFGPFGKEPYRDFFKTIFDGKYFHIGKADNLVSMCYVKNLIDLTLLLADKDDLNGRVYYGNDLYPYTMKQFADTVANKFKERIISVPDFIVYPATYILGLFKIVGLNVPLYPFRLRNIKATYCFEMSSVIEQGYVPQYRLDQALEETLSWYKKNDDGFKI